jgi:antitoxin (DNA-binding transcriptional repressor) of toxin-antitoxin stability system
MSTNTVTVTDAVRHFSEYISRVAYRHESFVLRKGRRPVAELRPVPASRRLGDLPAILRSLPRLSEEDAAQFARDIESARNQPGAGETRDPWES